MLVVKKKGNIFTSDEKKDTEFRKKLLQKVQSEKKADKITTDLRKERFNVPKLLQRATLASPFFWDVMNIVTVYFSVVQALRVPEVRHKLTHDVRDPQQAHVFVLSVDLLQRQHADLATPCNGGRNIMVVLRVFEQIAKLTYNLAKVCFLFFSGIWWFPKRRVSPNLPFS